MSPTGYREFASPPGLEALVACVWTSHDGEVRVLPDACVDVVLSDGRLVVAGPATEATVAHATPGQERVGVRFRVGAAGAALGVPAGELRDQGVPLAELWGADARRLEERVVAAQDSRAALLALIGGIARRLPPPENADHEVRRVALALARPAGVGPTSAVGSARAAGRGEAADRWRLAGAIGGAGTAGHGDAADAMGRANAAGARAAVHDDAATVAGSARAVGLSERQLRRRFERAVGYSPTTLARVLRFQRFLRCAHAPGSADAPLARLAAEAGYADQAHLARECRRLAGLPPSALLATGATPAGEPPRQ